MIAERAVMIAMIAAAVLLCAFDPARTWWFPSCPIHLLTGWLCPLCGSLRAIHALLVGAPVVALELNPLTTAALVAALVALVHDTVCPARAAQFERVTRFWFSAGGLAIAIGFGLLRNVPRPFGWVGH